MWTSPPDHPVTQIQLYDLPTKEIAVPKAPSPPRDDAALAVQAGSRLAAVRKTRGVTQIDLAARLGITQSMLSKYERGDLRLHGAMLTRIAESLSVSTDELLGIKVPPPPPSPVLKDKRLRRRIHQIDAFLSRAKSEDHPEPHRKAG
jgi:transcriptional regulator with XRE-family HTH domain